MPPELDVMALGPFLLPQGLTAQVAPTVLRLIYTSASEIRARLCPTPAWDKWTEPSARLAALKTPWATVLH